MAESIHIFHGLMTKWQITNLSEATIEIRSAKIKAFIKNDFASKCFIDAF